MLRDNDSPTFDSSRVFCSFFHGIESILVFLYIVALSLPREQNRIPYLKNCSLAPSSEGAEKVASRPRDTRVRQRERKEFFIPIS